MNFGMAVFAHDFILRRLAVSSLGQHRVVMTLELIGRVARPLVFRRKHHDRGCPILAHFARDLQFSQFATHVQMRRYKSVRSQNRRWTGGPAFEFVGISNTGGAPSFAYFAKGGYLSGLRCRF